MPRRLAVIILHYGEVALTRQLHEQLQRSDPGWDDLFVLDNHAPAPYPEAWTRLPENLYWAGGLRHAVQTCRDQGFSHLWFLNNDIRFITPAPILDRAWQRLARLEQTLGRVGVYSPAATANPYHPQMVQAPRRQYRSVSYVDGIAPLFDLACLEDIGGVQCEGNEYGYGVDVALSLAAQRAGWPVVVDHQVALKHAYHSTAKTIDGFLARAARAEDAYMQRAIGPNWRETLRSEANEFQDHDRM